MGNKYKGIRTKRHPSKYLYALYDKDDNFIEAHFLLCDFKFISGEDYLRINQRNGKYKMYKIPMTVTDDIFREEDEKFLQEFESMVLSISEICDKIGISDRKYFRLKKKNKLPPTSI